MAKRYPPIDPIIDSGIVAFVIAMLLVWSVIQIGSTVLGIIDCQMQDQETEAK